MDELKFKPAFVIGTALMLSALIFGSFYYFGQSATGQDVLSVTGSTKTRVTSDQAKLVVALLRVAPVSTLSEGYKNIARDLALVRGLLEKEGIPATDIIESPVSMNQMYDQYNSGGEIKYELRQTVSVQSGDVNKITELSKKVPDLSAQGVIISIQALEYYYSKLPDLRISLLSEAVKDAKFRAEKIADGTGRKIGSVETASNGVVQVLTPNSVEVSDYGSYDTSSIEKDVMVTIKASFRLK
ncbi:MAG: SIMPL domain-containing protein [Patescibacteria group bacterium]